MSGDDIERLAACVVDGLLKSPLFWKQFRKLSREQGLHIAVSQEEQRKAGMVRAFMSACGARGVDIRVNADGVLVSKNWSKLGPDLRAVLIAEREAITAHLVRLRDAEECTRRRLEEMNGPQAIAGKIEPKVV